MKTSKIERKRIIALAGTLALLTWQACAQDAADTAAFPQLPHGAAQVLQLEQAKVSDNTVISYIQTAGNSYNLSAEQILYLRQRGVSDAVLTAMLTQSKSVDSTPAISTPTAPVAQTTSATPAASTPPAPAVTIPPVATYVQTVPPYYYAPCYYPAPRYYVVPRPVVAVGWRRWGGWRVGVAWER